MSVFTEQEREELRAQLVSIATKDDHIIGAAHIGSAAAGRLDRWSDIDLALCLAPNANLDEVAADWTNKLYRECDAAAHHDVRYGSTLFRVFLLKNTLQIDLSFWPADAFAAIGPDFKLIFGKANDSRSVPASPAGELIGMAWLCALHVRSSIARGRLWQAEYMLSAMRDHVLALACIQRHLIAHQGRGLHDLPLEFMDAAAECLVRSLEPEELRRACRSTMRLLFSQIKTSDAELAERLAVPMDTLVESTK
jgi:hypothetical protein